MFFVVTVKQSREKAIVPKKWIQNLNMTNLLNYGIAYLKKREYKFYFPCNTAIDEEPDFQAPILERIDVSRSACYKARILKCSGKKIQ